MIRPRHLLDDVVRPTLGLLGLGGVAAEQLLVGTAVTESTVGHHTCLHQHGGGPALGLWQMEPATHTDLWDSVLKYKPAQAALVRQLVPPLYAAQAPSLAPTHRVLCHSLVYACAMARMQYWRWPDPLPAAGDWDGIAALWKARYNTTHGAGTPAHFLGQCSTHRVQELWA